MKTLIVATLIATGIQAQADGFRCESTDGELRVRVYNQVDPETGTRVPAKMIVSNPQISAGRKTIVTFTQDYGTLWSAHTNAAGLAFVGNVDLRYADISRKGEYLMGTRLGEVDTLRLDVDFSYANPVAAGTELDAELTLVKRDGKVIKSAASCVRYLKGE